MFNLKAFADGRINLTENLKFVLGRVENIVGNGENAGLDSERILQVSSKYPVITEISRNVKVVAR